MSSLVRKIGIVGSRTYPLPRAEFERLSFEERAEVLSEGQRRVEEFVGHLPSFGTRVISGGAKGVDSWAADAARAKGIPVVEIRPNWNKYGRAAGFERNTEIVRASHDLVAFWDGESRGTMDSVRKAHKGRLPYAVFGPAGNILVSVTEPEWGTDLVEKTWERLTALKKHGGKAMHRGR